MKEPISLKEAERKVFRTATDDGLWDVLIGSVVLMFSIAPLLSQRLGDFWSSVIFLPVWGLVYLVIWLVRKYVVKPRLGTVTFGYARRKKLTRWVRVALVANLMVLILGLLVFAGYGNLPEWLPVVIFGLIMLSGFYIAAYLLDFPRLYFYGTLASLSPLVGEWLYRNLGASHHGFPITFGVTACVMILGGLVIFALWLRHHPLPDQDEVAQEQVP